MTQKRIAYLKKLIAHHSHLYYNEETVLSDEQFDALADELRRLAPKSPALAKVGAKVSNTVWPEVKHESSMGSLLKVQTIEEFLDWAKKTGADQFCWSEKLDGSSLALKYEGKEFVQGLSRGDGITGSDISPNILKTAYFPKTLGFKSEATNGPTVWVRAEAIMQKADFEKKYASKIDEESGRTFKNPRNTAAGMIRRLTGTGCGDLGAVAYNVEGESYKFTTQALKFWWLQEAGFFTPQWGTGTAEEIVEVYRKYLQSEREACPFEIDGLVVCVNDLDLQERLGIVDNRPKGQRAFKFPSLEVETTLLAVVWQTGRSGRITPIAEIEPTDVGGVTISRVMLNNIDFIRDLNLGLGSKVMLRRANDVIPEIARGLTKGRKIEEPTSCPCCLSPVTKDGAYLICLSSDCSAQIIGHLLNYLRVLDVKGFGESTIAYLHQTGKLSQLPDFYKLKVEDFESEVMGKKLLAEFESKAREIALPTFVDALGIHGVGEHLTILVMAEFPNLHIMRTQATKEKLETISGIGPELAHAFISGLITRSSVIDELLKHVKLAELRVKVQATGDACKGWIACMTGFRSDEMTFFIESQGGTIASSMNKSVTHLIAKDTSGSSSKLTKAREKGLVVLSRFEIEEMM